MSIFIWKEKNKHKKVHKTQNIRTLKACKKVIPSQKFWKFNAELCWVNELKQASRWTELAWEKYIFLLITFVINFLFCFSALCFPFGADGELLYTIRLFIFVESTGCSFDWVINFPSHRSFGSL